jgi:plastocyanin
MNTRMTLTIGGLLLIAATATGCNGGSTNYSPASPTTAITPTVTPAPDPGYPDPTPKPDPVPADPDVMITIVGMDGGNSYSPNPAIVKVGQTVAWKNADGLPHTATADAGGFDTGTIGAGATSRAITMTTAGTFPYHCTIHGFMMTGTLTVTE